MTYPVPVFLDCDTGIDDSLAIAYRLADPSVNLVGISTVSGNITATQGARNTLDLLELAGRSDIPVAVGEPGPLVGGYTGAVPHIHGENGIGDVTLPRSGAVPSLLSGPELLLTMAQKYHGELRVIAIGPLTNLAIAITSAPELPQLVHSLTVMGGAFLVPGNVTESAEANIWNDPRAAALVAQAAWPLTFVPLDVTMENALTEADRQELLGSPDGLIRALGEILDVYFRFYETRYGDRRCALHDPLAAMIAVEAIATGHELVGGSITVEVAGACRGRTQHSIDSSGPPRRVVLETIEPAGPRLMERLMSCRSDAPGRRQHTAAIR
ncbi:nucleoside hydrolase [Leifsonia aquatica]|uniref:nucleoside hydrolase n=1 Tax=Leifsonia aquatica TaxID=144185 RepID=UPI00046A0EAC|nr:nucleoside hydrolase [Leifsonia aquatica]